MTKEAPLGNGTSVAFSGLNSISLACKKSIVLLAWTHPEGLLVFLSLQRRHLNNVRGSLMTISITSQPSRECLKSAIKKLIVWNILTL